MDNKKYIELLQNHGIKPTANRIVIAKALAHAVRPMSLSELEYNIMTIDKSNIFRALNVFKANHLVHAIEDGSDSVRYELCMSSDEHDDDDIHVHFYCENCHKTFCMEDTPVPAVELSEGYEMVTANYIIKGLCPKCAKK